MDASTQTLNSTADNTSASSSQLARYTQNLIRACDDAEQWVQRNPELLRNELESVETDLRRSRRILRKCALAADRKMCAGVFGPSQAGKSYLVSALASGSNNQLLAKFGKQTHDFLSELNPEGGKESTGLVTRFTLTDFDTPEGFPVRVRLLSETDLVRIIANAYYADFEHKAVGTSNIQAALEKLKTMAGAKNVNVDIDAMEDLLEYLHEEFGGKARIRELENKYFSRAAALAPGLEPDGRVLLYSVIWDEVEEFTELLRTLLQALSRLDFPEELFCSMDALIPRASSIIDVATLAKLTEKDEGGISVRTPKGLEARLPRAVLAALVAELTIVMRDQPAPYFSHTDLLDFPGYRSRYNLPDARAELKKKGMLKELFLRGKVAYLFQRYCAERELNSMLLCIGPGNQEVQDLPGVIDNWIRATHGATPEARIGRKIALLFVLTKFDMEFEDKKGSRDGFEGRWDTRLRASLLNFFGLGHTWPAEWTPGHGFNNIFLLRNPNFKFDAVLNYKEDEETGIRPERQAFVDELRAAFMASPLVARHIRQPARAWDEAMRLNDGGISRIREALNPLCDPAIKQAQLAQSINAIREHLQRRLGQFYKSDDREELRKQKLALVLTLFRELGTLEERQKRLGQLLRSFTITDAFAYDLHAVAVRRFEAMSESQDNQQPEEPVEVDVSSLDLSSLNPFASEPAPQNDPMAPQQDEAGFYAAYIENKWVERLHQLADNPDAQKYFLLRGKDFSALTSELAAGAARLGFREKMASQFRKTAAYADARKESIVRKQAAIAANMLNQYVDWLGYNPLQKDAPHTVVLPGGKTVKLFEPEPEPCGMPALGETRSPYTRRWFADWLNALAGLVMENVNFDGQQTVNVAENTALGLILSAMAQPPGQSATVQDM